MSVHRKGSKWAVRYRDEARRNRSRSFDRNGRRRSVRRRGDATPAARGDQHARRRTRDPQRFRERDVGPDACRHRVAQNASALRVAVRLPPRALPRRRAAPEAPAGAHRPLAGRPASGRRRSRRRRAGAYAAGQHPAARAGGRTHRLQPGPPGPQGSRSAQAGGPAARTGHRRACARRAVRATRCSSPSWPTPACARARRSRCAGETSATGRCSSSVPSRSAPRTTRRPRSTARCGCSVR